MTICINISKWMHEYLDICLEVYQGKVQQKGILPSMGVSPHTYKFEDLY